MLPEGEGPATLEAADAALVAGEPQSSPEVEAPAVAAEPAAPTEGPPRDEQGRFTSPPPTPEPEPAQAEAASAETPGEPQAEPVVEAPADEYPVLSYRADGQEFALPGSAVGEDGAFIPKDQLPELQQLLSAGKAAFGSVRQRLGEAAEREHIAISRAEAAEAQAQHLLAHFESLIESGQMAGWLEQVQLNWPILKAEAKAKAIEMQGKAAQEQLAKYQQKDEQARLKPLMQQTLTQGVETYGQRAGLDQDTMKDVLAELQDPRMENLVFIRAPFDDPASGIKQGELVIDYGVVEAAAQRAAKWVKRFGNPKPAEQQQKIAAAIKQNATVEPPKGKVPPTVGAKGTKAPRQGAAIPTFKTTKEADAWFLEGGGNELDVA